MRNDEYSGIAEAVHFGDRTVGDGSPRFIVFEAGATHDGLQTAKELVSLAADAGADAVKFQVYDPGRLMSDREQTISFGVLVDKATGATETITERLYDTAALRAMCWDDWRKLKEHADREGIMFFATACFPDEVAFLVEMGCRSIKISSADINHFPLIRQAARTGICLQLDTGTSTIGEVETAIDVALAEGCRDIIVHHCPSGYPARLESVNLNVIPTLKRILGCPIGFSDHTPGWEMDVAAVALGANLVEKTITLDRSIRRVEHMFSLEPQEMRNFVKTIREVEKAMGETRRILHEEERRARTGVRRSAFLTEPAKAGTSLGEASIDFRRPGYGIGPDIFETLAERKVYRDLPAGHMLSLADLR